MQNLSKRCSGYAIRLPRAPFKRCSGRCSSRPPQIIRILNSEKGARGKHLRKKVLGSSVLRIFTQGAQPEHLFMDFGLHGVHTTGGGSGARCLPRAPFSRCIPRAPFFQGAYPEHIFRIFLPHEKVLGLLQSPPPEHLWPNCTTPSTFCKGARVVAIGKKVLGSLQ